MQSKISIQKECTEDNQDWRDLMEEYENLSNVHKQMQDKINELNKFGSVKYEALQYSEKKLKSRMNEYVDAIFAMK